MKANGSNGNERHDGDLAVAMVLDKSGSMAVVRGAVIDGYNGYLEELREADRANGSQTRFWLTLFDTQFEQVWAGKRLDTVPPLDLDHYNPDGMTALYDAIAHTILETDRNLSQAGDVEMKVLVVVLTDGAENSSQEYNAAALSALVAKYEARENWTFVYLGAGHETLEEARVEAERIGVKRENAMRWRTDADSARASMDMLSQATVTRKTAAARKSEAFFADAGQSENDYIPHDGEQPPRTKRNAPLTRTPLRDVIGKPDRRS